MSDFGNYKVDIVSYAEYFELLAGLLPDFLVILWQCFD